MYPFHARKLFAFFQLCGTYPTNYLLPKFEFLCKFYVHQKPYGLTKQKIQIPKVHIMEKAKYK